MGTPSKAISPGYLDRLFERLLAMYGEKFVRQWSMVPVETMKRTWAEELADLTTEELKRGLNACRTREWPPTLPEFRNLCRAPLDYEAAFHEAAQWYGIPGAKWSAAAVYWAAVQVGNDVRGQPYKVMVSRWKAALDYALAHKSTTPIPEAPQARVEDKGKVYVPMPQHVREQLTRFSRSFGKVQA